MAAGLQDARGLSRFASVLDGRDLRDAGGMAAICGTLVEWPR
jgi:hypothetical protein